MKKICFITVIQIFSIGVFAQSFTSDTSADGNSITHKDERVDLLGKKMAEYNEGLSKKIQMVDGFRIQVLNTADRSLARKVRSSLIQNFSDQKVYMSFVAPYIKLKLGNFIERVDAEKVSDKITDLKIVSGNIYIIPEKVEQKPLDKTATPEE